MSIEAKILKQVEFYFSDSNYPTDKFLQEAVAKGSDGWVPLSVLITFKRLAAVTTDLAVIASALEKSSGLLEVSEDKQSVRRSPLHPLPAENQSNKRSVYIKGFNTATLTIELVEEFLAAKGYKILAVRLRKDKSKGLKPSVFVELESDELAEKLAADASVKDDASLSNGVVEMKEAYLKRKKLELLEKRDKKKDKKGGEGGEPSESVSEKPLEVGCVVHFTNASPDTSREDLKGAYGPYGEVSWVDFQRGDTEGFLRFKSAADCEKALKGVAEHNVLVKGNTLTHRLLEGEEEKTYWTKMNEFRAQSFGKKGFKGGNKKGRERKHQGNRASKRSKVSNDDDDE